MKHPMYQFEVQLTSGLNETDAMPYLMEKWTETIRENDFNFLEYVVSFYAKDHPFEYSRIGYQAVHIEDWKEEIRKAPTD